MGVFDLLFRRGGDYLALPPIASPWSEGSNLVEITRQHILGIKTEAASRAEAMKVPAVVKGRALIAGTLSRYPLRVDKGDIQQDTPKWLTTIDPAMGQTPQGRMVATLDDLIFRGSSLWYLERNKSGEITEGLHLNWDDWDQDPATGIISIGGEGMKPEQVCLIPGMQEGLLTIAADTIGGARDLDAAWIQRVESPVPLINLHNTDPNSPLEPNEIEELVADWESARREGGTAYTPADLEAHEMGGGETDLFIQGRNALRLDIANFLSLPGGMLDGSTATASLTYSTKEGQRNEVVDYALAYWAMPIEARLSLDDIVSPGQTVRFDLEWLSTPVQDGRGPRWDD